ncbi:MAG: hypothetical protein ACOCUY_01310 [Verrucomicrobiota bacterium]
MDRFSALHRQRLSRGLNILLVLGLAGVIGCILAVSSEGVGTPHALARLEQEFAAAGKQALRFDTEAGSERHPLVRIAFTPDTLKSHQLLLKSPNEREYIRIDADGRITKTGDSLGTLSESGLITEGANDRCLSVDGRILARNLVDWDLLWIGEPGTRPDAKVSRAPVVDFTDNFMRQKLVNDDWTLNAGEAELYRHGGGMPTSEKQQNNPNFQRAVNPFTVRTRDNADLTFGNRDWGQYHAEARFLFGIPRSGNVIDRDTLPTETNMLVTQGPEDGHQVAFGWRGETARYVLMTRANANSPWQIVAKHDGPRPPLTNWARVGLQVLAGGRAKGFLDGKQVLEAKLDHEIRGPAHILTGTAVTEFDDVSAWSLPRPARDQAPYFLKSKHFTGKKNKHDPEQFYQWTQATEFFQPIKREQDGLTHSGIVTAKPLMGSFEYTSIPDDPEAGKLPEGRYAFAFIAHSPDTFPDTSSEPRPERVLHAQRSDGLWRILDAEGTPNPTIPALFTLHLRRRAGTDAQLVLVGPNDEHDLFDLPENQILMSVARVYDDGVGSFPRPEHHRITCANLTNELFENAPTDWSWIHGAFRMDMRWACQDQWNFMASGSPSVPYMVSKRRYTGNQEHEFYMSLRPMMPWDAGDESWSYDPDADRKNGFKILHKHHGFYIRHDLNFSFCTNGRDPLSGYTVIFGGEDNQRTMLLRKGRVVAEVDHPDQLFPTDKSHRAVHWKWWGFRIRKYGERIQVKFNGNLLFDYTDPEPLNGGHIGYWTVRNGFTLARAVSMAAAVSKAPHVLYVQPDQQSHWQPLRRDAVHLQRTGNGRTRVTANVGAGEIAVRHQFDEPVKLTETPVLLLPLTLGPGCRLNLFVETEQHSGVVEINAPTSGIKALLTPEFEVGECFRLQQISSERMNSTYRLANAEQANEMLRVNLLDALRNLDIDNAGDTVVSLTLGNASNSNYLKAGNGGNTAGTHYTVGTPRFVPASDTRRHAAAFEEE